MSAAISATMCAPRCRVIAVKRALAAFAFVALFAETAAAAEVTEKIGNWDYVSVTGATGSRSRFVAVVRGEKGVLVFKCDSPGSNSVYGGFYATRDESLYDKPTAPTFDPKRAVTIANALKDAETFVVNARTRDEVVKTEFNVAGADTAMVRLMADCQN